MSLWPTALIKLLNVTTVYLTVYLWNFFAHTFWEWSKCAQNLKKNSVTWESNKNSKTCYYTFYPELKPWLFVLIRNCQISKGTSGLSEIWRQINLMYNTMLVSLEVIHSEKRPFLLKPQLLFRRWWSKARYQITKK